MQNVIVITGIGWLIAWLRRMLQPSRSCSVKGGWGSGEVPAHALMAMGKGQRASCEEGNVLTHTLEKVHWKEDSLARLPPKNLGWVQ